MKEKMRSYLNRIKGDRKKRRREMSLVLALSLMVTGGVSWQLRSTGTAMNDIGLENARGHTPDEEFTEETLTGGEEAPPGSDLIMETPQQWEETLPDTLSGVWREDTNAVARSQLGYRESAAQLTAAEDGTEHFGYTRYGAWYGNPWGEWNTMFVYFCLHYAGKPGTHKEVYTF